MYRGSALPKNKRTIKDEFYPLKSNQQIIKHASLFGCETSMNNHIPDIESVVSVLENDEPPQAISSLILPKLPLQAACYQVVASPASGPLPSPESRIRFKSRIKRRKSEFPTIPPLKKISTTDNWIADFLSREFSSKNHLDFFHKHGMSPMTRLDVPDHQFSFSAS